METLEDEDKNEDNKTIENDLIFHDVFGSFGDDKGDFNSNVLPESSFDIAWGETHIGSGVIIRRWLTLEGETKEARYLQLYDILERLRNQGKTGFHFSIANKTGTDRHEMAIDRLIWLLKYHKTDLILPPYDRQVGPYLDQLITNPEERQRFNDLDNIKKYQYQPDLYTFRQKIKEDKQLIHYDRRIIEFDGGYHKKYRQMVKDEWRDHDTRLIFPDITIIRFDVDEVVPETILSSGDHCSTDLDLLRKFCTGRNFFSRPDKIDDIGKPIREHLRLNTEDAERRDH
jgi:hypothetical protein